MLEIRLFYVRISPSSSAAAAVHLRLLRGGTSAVAAAVLRRTSDELAGEATYVSTDTLRISGDVDFEVIDDDSILLCGSLSRFDTEWSMDCYPGGSFSVSISKSSSCFEVYVAGRWNDTPVILTKVVSLSPRRRSPKYSNLDSIPEVSDDVEKDRQIIVTPTNSLIRHRNLQLNGSDDEYDAERKMPLNYYPEDIYIDEDGQLTWFNAGVRVGVGIGLGMCLGLGIGVGLLMRTYQTTTRNFRRRFF